MRRGCFSRGVSAFVFPLSSAMPTLFRPPSFRATFSLFCTFVRRRDLHGLCDVRLTVGDNGTLTLWDYDTGTPFQHMDDIPQPGSLEAEAGVFCSTFDVTGTRLITGGADKTIKVRLALSPVFFRAIRGYSMVVCVRLRFFGDVGLR